MVKMKVKVKGMVKEMVKEPGTESQSEAGTESQSETGAATRARSEAVTEAGAESESLTETETGAATRTENLSIPAGLCLALLLMVSACGSDAPPGDYTLTVSAGGLDRIGTIVSFALPDRMADGVYEMHGAGGETVTLQVAENRGYFLLERLPAGESLRYSFDAGPPAGADSGPSSVAGRDPASVRNGPASHLGAESLDLTLDGRPVLSYHHLESEPPDGIDPRFRRAGYLHPVRTPSGVNVVRQFNPGRPHQYGIWSAWSRTDFDGRQVEFWAALENNGRVEADSLQIFADGPVLGGFRAWHRFVDYSAPEPVTALNEQWELRLYAVPAGSDYHLFDVELVQSANTGLPVRMQDAVYGGISIRGPDDWDGEGLMNYLSAEGYDRSDAVGRPVRWSHLGGETGGETVGIALFGHPENRDHPHRVFLNQTEPFFSYGPAPAGEMSVEPGSPWRARYRLLVHDGEPDRAELERLWNDFAWPPAVTVVRNR